jgi:hypothetical protein
VQVLTLPTSKPQSIVNIAVSKAPHTQTFHIHKDLLCYHSAFFARALKWFNGRVVEGKTQTMVLENVEASVFGLMAYWLYAQDIEDEECEDAVGNIYQQQQSATQLARLWLLAERFTIPRLQNKIISILYDRHILRVVNRVLILGVHDGVGDFEVVGRGEAHLVC